MENKFVLVTGAYGGLGRAVVSGLLEKGYSVFAADVVVDDSFKSQRLVPIRVDVTNDEDVRNACRVVSGYTDSLFAVVNLAGVFYLDSIIEGEEDKLRRIFEINFFGAYKMNRAFLPFLKSRESRVINVTSELAGYSPQPFMGYYTVSKGMLDIYTDVLRRELNYVGVKVVKIQSGSFRTKLLNNAGQEYDNLIEKTQRFKTQLAKLKFMMDKELKKQNSPTKFAKLVVKILKKKKPKICYRINRSFGLRFLSALPEKWQDGIYLKFIK